jgi:hypothetical protein
MEYLKQEMKDVIETSKEVRNYLSNKKINITDRIKELPLCDRTLNANKNIVSAANILLKIKDVESRKD